MIALGKISRPFGIKGELLLRLYNPSGKSIYNAKRVFLGEKSREIFEVILSGARAHKNGVIIKIGDLTSRNDADRFKGMELLIDEGGLEPLPKGEYYWKDLIGLKVLNEDGEEGGRVKNIIETPGHELLEISGEEETYIPLLKKFIKEINIREGFIIVKENELK